MNEHISKSLEAFRAVYRKKIHTLTYRYPVAGMPSTHSMVGLAVPATVVYVTTGKYDISLSLGIAISW
jgi:hypothetical protein